LMEKDRMPHALFAKTQARQMQCLQKDTRRANQGT
jgi:hypothetical protein